MDQTRYQTAKESRNILGIVERSLSDRGPRDHAAMRKTGCICGKALRRAASSLRWDAVSA
jgi:hypothetical protein